MHKKWQNWFTTASNTAQPIRIKNQLWFIIYFMLFIQRLELNTFKWGSPALFIEKCDQIKSRHKLNFLTKAVIKTKWIETEISSVILIKMCSESGKMEFVPFCQRLEWNKWIEIWISSVIFSKFCSESSKNGFYAIIFNAGIKYMKWNGDVQLYFY